MKIRLLKKWRVYVIGTTLDVFDGTAKALIKEGIAETYDGTFPTRKMKTDFFKPKSIKGNGKGKRK